jgi:hypothetical protein
METFIKSKPPINAVISLPFLNLLIMKKFSFIIALLFSVSSLFAQDPTVTITGPVTSFNPDPNTLCSYTPSIVNNGWSIVSGSHAWNGVNGAFNLSGQNNSVFNCQWLNTTNSPQKKVTLSITFSKTGQPNKTISVERVVVVKFLSPVTALLFTGGNVSQTNPANGGTITIPCNAGSITLNATQTSPLTDPSAAITYTWTVPNGVAPTSTGTVTFNGSGTADGIVKVSAKRNDGSFVSEFTVNFVRNRVTTPSIVNVFGGTFCLAGSKLFGATSTNATNFSWATSGTFTLGNVGGTNNSLAGVTVNGSGTGFITVTANNACNSPVTQSFNFPTGTPILSNVLVNGTPASSFNYINNPCILGTTVPNDGAGMQTGYKWTIENGVGSLYPNSGGSGVTYNGVTYDHGGSGYAYAYDFIRVKVATANVCGEGGSQYLYLQNVGNMYRMASPNPAQNQISVELTKDAPAEMLKSITVVSDQQATVSRSYNEGGVSDRFSKRQAHIVNFDVSNLPRGKYFVVLIFAGNKKYTEQVILN